MTIAVWILMIYMSGLYMDYSIYYKFFQNIYNQNTLDMKSEETKVVYHVIVLISSILLFLKYYFYIVVLFQDLFVNVLLARSERHK